MTEDKKAARWLAEQLEETKRQLANAYVSEEIAVRERDEAEAALDAQREQLRGYVCCICGQRATAVWVTPSKELATVCAEHLRAVGGDKMETDTPRHDVDRDKT